MSHKLLVVDDDKEIAETLKQFLARKGYAVVVAFDGEEALAKIKQEKPDVILLDLIMPKLNGFEVLKKIRTLPQEKWMPVIIISAKAELEAVKSCYDLEADMYLTKPCEIEKILRGIETMISLIPLRQAD